MNRQISFSQYRAIDLTILTVVLAACQGLIWMATSFWYPEQNYVVSPVAGMAALVLMRWSGWAAIPMAAGGVLYAFLSGGSVQHLLIYGIGNLAALAALLMFKLYGKERIRKESFLAVVFAIAVQLLMQLGRAGMAALFGHSAAVCFGFITTDILSILFTVFIVWTVRRILFGIFCMGFDVLFISCKNLMKRIIADAKKGQTR